MNSNLFGTCFLDHSIKQKQTLDSFYTFQKKKKEGKISKFQRQVWNVEVMTMSKVRLYLISLAGTMMRRAGCCLTLDPIVPS